MLRTDDRSGALRSDAAVALCEPRPAIDNVGRTPDGDAWDAEVERSALSVMTWNLEWFEDPKQGPADDAAQYAAVRDILTTSGTTLVALEEVASEPAFARLLRDLPRYAGVLSGYDWVQRTALLWDSSAFELQAVRAISGFDDAGRPPLEVRLRDKHDHSELLVVVIHAKAQADAASYQKRAHLAQDLKTLLDMEHAATPLIVLGDFNDLLIGSITKGEDTPYRPFLDDPAYFAPTRELDAPGARERSFATGATVDHILVSDELAARVDPASVRVLRNALIARYPDYTMRVSDHFPVTLTLAW